jgi:hypothetical protein
MLNRRSAIGGFLGSLGMMGSVNKNEDVFVNGYSLGTPLKRYSGECSLGPNPIFKPSYTIIKDQNFDSAIVLLNNTNPFVNDIYVGMDIITAFAGSLNNEAYRKNDLGGDSYIILRDNSERAGLYDLGAEATEYLRECDYPECGW